MGELYLLLGTSRVVALTVRGYMLPREYLVHPYRIKFLTSAIYTDGGLAFVREDGRYHTWVDIIGSIEVEDEEGP